jgi:hypothetical protein
MEMEEKANVKMLELTIENKKMKRKLKELMVQQKEWQELKKKKYGMKQNNNIKKHNQWNINIKRFWKDKSNYGCKIRRQKGT